MEKIKQNGAFAFGALWVVLREHDIHETPRTPNQHHRRGLRAVGGVPAEAVVLIHLRRHARARRRRRRHRRRSPRRLHRQRIGPRRRQVQL